MNNLKALYIDLDGTVYDKNNGMWEEMSSRIDRYMNEKIGIPAHKVVETREKYYRKFGSTLRGLQLYHEIDSEDFLAYIHDLDLNKFPSPDPELRSVLENISLPKWILTNSDRNHTTRVLNVLGLNGIFEGILDVWTMGYIPKPDVRVYRRALRLTGDYHPSECMFIDDTLKNLGTPMQLGFKTVWIDNSKQHPHASFCIPRLHDLPTLLNPIPAPMYLFPGTIGNRIQTQTTVPAVAAS